MKTFEEYNDGDWVTYNNPNSNWHLKQFQAYKSQWTYNAFRLKYGSREVVADISEIVPISQTTELVKGHNEDTYRDLQFDALSRQQTEDEHQTETLQD